MNLLLQYSEIKRLTKSDVSHFKNSLLHGTFLTFHISLFYAPECLPALGDYVFSFSSNGANFMI